MHTTRFFPATALILLCAVVATPQTWAGSSVMSSR